MDRTAAHRTRGVRAVGTCRMGRAQRNPSWCRGTKVDGYRCAPPILRNRARSIYVRTAARYRRASARHRSAGRGCTGRSWGVRSISRSSAFISAALRRRPARTLPWQAMVAATCIQPARRLQRLVPRRRCRRRDRAPALQRRPRRAAPASRAPPRRRGRRLRSPGRVRRASGARVASRCTSSGASSTTSGMSRIWRATPLRRRAASSCARRRCRSCAACWSTTMTMPRSLCATM
jgi:hypothetical protein